MIGGRIASSDRFVLSSRAVSSLSSWASFRNFLSTALPLGILGALPCWSTLWAKRSITRSAPSPNSSQAGQTNDALALPQGPSCSEELDRHVGWLPTQTKQALGKGTGDGSDYSNDSSITLIVSGTRPVSRRFCADDGDDDGEFIKKSQHE